MVRKQRTSRATAAETTATETTAAETTAAETTAAETTAAETTAAETAPGMNQGLKSPPGWLAEKMRSEEALFFREAKSEDAAVIAEIFNESIAAGDSTMVTELESAESVRRWIENFQPRETILLLERGGDVREVVGWGLIKRYSDRGGYRFACETAVFLHRSEVRKGYGSRIKWALIERCRQLRYHHMVAKIFADNTRSIEYNKKFGYELVGIQKEIGFRQGRWRDIAILQLVLEDVPPELPEHLK